MARAAAVVLALLVGGAPLAHAGARRTVWLRPDAGGRRPELALFASGDAARACGAAVTRARVQEGAAARPAPEGGQPVPKTTSASLRAACAGIVGLRHATGVELLPPPGACGEGLKRVRVLDGTFRGRVGCVHGDALRVP